MSEVVSVLTDTREVRPIGRGDGVFYLGHPEWLTKETFSALQHESREQRAGADRIRSQHFAEMGPVGQTLCDSPELAAFVDQFAAPARRSGKANYRYYDIPESQVPPHLDSDDFALNVIIMLSHEAVTERRSALLLFPHGPQPVTVCLKPGEVILFHAKEVIHARTPISDHGDERAENMGIGFTPIGEVENPGYWHPTEGWSPA